MQVEEGMYQADHHHSTLADLLCLVNQKEHLTREWLTIHAKHLDLARFSEVKGASLL